jgi:hypothetical protein
MNKTFPYSKAKNQQEAYNTGKTYITPELLAKYKIKAKVTHSDENYTICGDGKGFKLDLRFNENEVDINLKLSFFLKGFSSTIMGIIEKEVGKTI